MAGRPAIEWARSYVLVPQRSAGPGPSQASSSTASPVPSPAPRPPLPALEPGRCGTTSEKLAFEAVRACVSRDLGHVKEFVTSVSPALRRQPQADADDYPDEVFYGRAGALYLLRMVRHWVPNSAPLVEGTIVRLTERIMSRLGEWTWRGKPYLGAVHGDIGIITQLVLTTPPMADRLEGVLKAVLEAQREDGNWPASAKEEGPDQAKPCLVQFCHGAPGVVHALLSLRPYFPNLETEITEAIKRGRECVWREGLLKKEPNLCHGIFGNALIFPPGQQRDHFLAMATPRKMEELRKDDPTLFEPAAYGLQLSAMNYTPSAAWTWFVCGKDSPKYVGFNDI